MLVSRRCCCLKPLNGETCEKEINNFLSLKEALKIELINALLLNHYNNKGFVFKNCDKNK